MLWLQNEKQHVLIFNLQSNLITLQDSVEKLENNNQNLTNKFESLELKNKNLQNKLRKYEEMIQNEKEIEVIIPNSQRYFSTIRKKENNTIRYDTNFSINKNEKNDEYKITPEVFIDTDKQKIEGLKINIETKIETEK